MNFVSVVCKWQKGKTHSNRLYEALAVAFDIRKKTANIKADPNEISHTIMKYMENCKHLPYCCPYICRVDTLTYIDEHRINCNERIIAFRFMTPSIRLICIRIKSHPKCMNIIINSVGFLKKYMLRSFGLWQICFVCVYHMNAICVRVCWNPANPNTYLQSFKKNIYGRHS